MFNLTDVSVTFGTGKRRLVALDGVSLEVRRQEIMAVIGETGSGKTTLLRVVAGLTSPSEGRLSFHRGAEAGWAAVGGTGSPLVQVVFQDPGGSLNPRIPVWKSIVEPASPKFWRTPRALRQLAVDLMSRTGLAPDLADRLPSGMSGGQRQRVTIARALASTAPVLLLDEPVASLDASVQGEVLRLLAELRRERGLTYLIISHDLGAVAKLADRVAVLYLGKVIELGPARRILNDPRHPYTRALIDAVPRIGSRRRERVVIAGEMPDPRHPPTGCRFHTRCPYAVERCVSERPVLAAASYSADSVDGHVVACHRSDEWPLELERESRGTRTGTTHPQIV